ncbi:ImpA family metalloprotease [Endozoicomonas elysicola]|uniref:ImpA family metalloprotease n=1 Tax=Endozoicomonas elysicola TaxID=305900 RepID=UPI00037A6DE5|nr:ImpA family metalloprotease [Endozoicomonas elysicola]
MEFIKTLFIVLLLTTLTACKNGSSDDSGSNKPEPDPVDQALQSAFQTGDASGIPSADSVIQKIDNVIAKGHGQFNSVIYRLFQLNADGSTNANSLTNIDWDVTHDSAIIAPEFGKSATFLQANASDRSEFDPLKPGALGVLGEEGNSRFIALSSNPMRVWKRFPSAINAQANQLMVNSIDWLAGQSLNSTAPMNIVIAQMDESHYFPDQSSTRLWIDTFMPGRVSYNDREVCNGAALSSCLEEADVLIVSSYGELTEGLKDGINKARSQGIGILYPHYYRDDNAISQYLLPALNANFVANNYWSYLILRGFNIVEWGNPLSTEVASVNRLLTTLKNQGNNINFAQCNGSDCSEADGFNDDFLNGLQTMQGQLRQLDRNKHAIFTSANDDKALWRWLVLLADYYRAATKYPLDKLNNTEDFVKAAFSDFGVYQYRPTNAIPADLGNFGRTDFSHITPTSKNITITSKVPFRSAGVYVMPGKPVTIHRTDNTEAVVSVFVNSIRDGATHWLDNDGYKRPRYLWGQEMIIAPGEILTFTSPNGGPLQLRFDRNDQQVSLNVSNIGLHPYWTKPQDNEDFAEALEKGDFDWAELVTDGFEVHSRLDLMRQSMSNWNNSAADLAAVTDRYMSNLPHMLAGFRGDRIDENPEIIEFAERRGLAIDLIDQVKHMNADQATCGYGCSGNPYDAYWAFDPLGHGDLHELGHGLEKGRFLFDSWSPGHTATNFYSYFSKSRAYKELNKTPGCQSLPFKTLFDWLQAAQATDDPFAHMQQQDFSDWSSGAAVYIQMMMAAQSQGTLIDGWMLLPRLHIVEREFYRALSNSDTWNQKRERLGFSTYSWEEAKSIAKNDWPTIALSVVTGLDMRDYLYAWGLTGSQKALEQVSALNLPPMESVFYKTDGSLFCEQFENPAIVIENGMTWDTPAAL